MRHLSSLIFLNRGLSSSLDVAINLNYGAWPNVFKALLRNKKLEQESFDEEQFKALFESRVTSQN